MAHNWQIAGHKKQLGLLSKSVDSGNVAHAYIFSGPDAVGKRAVATNFARVLICESSNACKECPQCKSFTAGTNPDFIELKQDEIIKIEQVRQLIYKLNLKPYMARHKVAVIDSADNMTTEAANALLKSMEEPKSHTIIILITSNPYRLLPTIMSRAQRISFGPVAKEDYAGLLSSVQGEDQKQAIEVFAAGRPGLALEIANNPELLDELNQTESQFKEYVSGDLADRLKLAQDLSLVENPQLKNVLQYWLAGLLEQLHKDPNEETMRKLSGVAKARGLLDTNVSVKLLLAQMMIES